MSIKDFGGQSGFGFTKELHAMEKSGGYQPCHVTHPPLPLVVGDDKYVIYGGSCNNPKISGCDVYIGFDYGMKLTPDSYPWETAKQKTAVEVYFRIPDMGTPSSVKDFKALIKWTIEQLKAGKKVHAGCIGGHGRTGTFFSALVKEMMGIEDSTTYVRENYCDHAVESREQVQWLEKHFGVKAVKGYKEGSGKGGWAVGGGMPKGKVSSHSGVGKSLMPSTGSAVGKTSRSYDCVPSLKSIWGKAACN